MAIIICTACSNTLALCAVLSLGRIEWLHPGFHAERYLWPVGYCACRTIATPRSAMQPAAHTCEVTEAPDGSGPLFRCGNASCSVSHATLPLEKLVSQLMMSSARPSIRLIVVWQGDGWQSGGGGQDSPSSLGCRVSRGWQDAAGKRGAAQSAQWQSALWLVTATGCEAAAAPAKC